MTGIELKLLTDIDMLLMIERGIRIAMCHVITRYTKFDNKYMKYSKKGKKSLSLMHWNLNNLIEWAMSLANNGQCLCKLLANEFKWIKKTERFNKTRIKYYYDNSNEGYFLEVDIEYFKYLQRKHKNLSFLP